MSEHTRIKLKRNCKRPKYRETRNCKKSYRRGSCKLDLWTDSYVDISVPYIIRYLQSNVGRPYNKVYSKLVKKIKRSHIPIYIIKNILSLVIVDGKKRALYRPSFYLTNGILNINKVTNKKKNI